MSTGWLTGMMTSGKDKAFAKLLKTVSESPDSRDFYSILEKYPDLVNRQDKDGRTALMYAAKVGHIDVMMTLIEFNKANVTIRDKDGKDVSDYIKEFTATEVTRLTNRYKDRPEDMKREVDKIKSSQTYILKEIDNVKTQKSAELAEPLTRVSKTYGKLTGDKKMDALALASKYVTGVPGEPTTVMAQAKKTLGRGRRKTKKTRKTKSRRM